MFNNLLDLLLADSHIELWPSIGADLEFDIILFTPEKRGIIGSLSEDRFSMFDVRVYREDEAYWVTSGLCPKDWFDVKVKYFPWLSEFEGAYPVGFGIYPIPTDEQVEWHLAMNGLESHSDLMNHDRRHMAFGVGFSSYEEEFITSIEYAIWEPDPNRISKSSSAEWAREFKKNEPKYCKMLGL